MLVAVEAFLTSDYRSMIEQVWSRVPTTRVIYIGTGDWDDLLAAADAVSPKQLEERGAGLEPDDPINIQYTSGTTGFPKGATLSHRNILNNGLFIGEACKYTPADRVCIPVPFYHCFGMVLGNLACTTHGSAMVIPAAGFNPRATLHACAAERCTSLYGVPTMFIAELGEPDLADYDLSSLRTGIMAGSPCPIEVMRQVVEHMNMSEVTIAYGMTETSPVSTQTSADDPLEKRVTTVGRVHPHVEIKIVDPDTGEVVPRGTSGEFQTRGYSVMLGYWNDPERTAEAIDSDGWMHTGDLAVMDDEGYVNIVGRIKDMIIRGGENVYPREIEEFLYTHPDIVDVQVIGVPDVRYGEEIMAWIQLRDSADTTAADIKDFLPGHHRPLQGPPLHQVHRHLPHDHHRQDPEVQDARAVHRRTRPRQGGSGSERLGAAAVAAAGPQNHPRLRLGGRCCGGAAGYGDVDHGAPGRFGRDGLDGDRAAEVVDHEGAHDGEAEPGVAVQREAVGDPTAVVGYAHAQRLGGASETHLDLRARSSRGPGVLEGVLHQLHQHHRQRHRGLAVEFSDRPVHPYLERTAPPGPAPPPPGAAAVPRCRRSQGRRWCRATGARAPWRWTRSAAPSSPPRPWPRCWRAGGPGAEGAS